NLAHGTAALGDHHVVLVNHVMDHGEVEGVAFVPLLALGGDVLIHRQEDFGVGRQDGSGLRHTADFERQRKRLGGILRDRSTRNGKQQGSCSSSYQHL